MAHRIWPVPVQKKRTFDKKNFLKLNSLLRNIHEWKGEDEIPIQVDLNEGCLRPRKTDRPVNEMDE